MVNYHTTMELCSAHCLSLAVSKLPSHHPHVHVQGGSSSYIQSELLQTQCLPTYRKLETSWFFFPQ